MDLQYPEFRSRTYLLAKRATDCWFCGASTSVVAVGLPAGHEVLGADEESDSSIWQSMAARALLSYIQELPTSVETRLRALAPGFRLAPGDSSRAPYWANHCEHCSAVLDDQELHSEPGDTFVPISQSAGLEIQLAEIDEAFEARAGGCSIEPEFLPSARQR